MTASSTSSSRRPEQNTLTTICFGIVRKEIAIGLKSKKMVEKIIRTFHPVGQGAFYSERFFVNGQSNARFNVVYDCGAGYGYVTKAQKVVSQSFNTDDDIDYLFLSHLDYDHISLVRFLKQNVRRVKNIVMPFMYEDDIVFMITMMKTVF